MNDVQVGTLMIWLTRFVFAITFGVAFWHLTHSTTTRGVIGYGLFILIWTGMCVGWLKILETLRDEEIAKRDNPERDLFG